MELRWSLDELYTSFESEELSRDLITFSKEIQKINDWGAQNLIDHQEPIKKMEEFINLENRFHSLANKLIKYPKLVLSVQAKNEKAAQLIEQIENLISETISSFVKFQKWIGRLENLDNLINQSPLLEDHRLYLTILARQSKFLLTEEEEVLLSRLASTGSKAWTRLQNTLTSTLMLNMEVEGRDEKLPLSVVRNLSTNPNSQIRRKAYEIELQTYKQIAESSAMALNGIKGEALIVSKMKGYDSPLEETLQKAKMEPDTLEVMLRAMEEFLPVFSSFYRLKAELLGYKEGLPFYELFAPIGDIDLTFTYEEARECIISNFRSFSEKLSNFAINAFSNRWIDAEPRLGKRSGAFCSNIYSIGQSRISLNFNGSFSNVTTLAHELGHGYHGECLKFESFLNTCYPLPLAEAASIFSETIVTQGILQKANQRDAIGILESSISHYGQVIVDIYSRFIFEKKLFEIRKDRPLTVNELNELMVEAQKASYGNGLDFAYLHPYMWINKTHYYNVDRNFYNFPYAFGLLFAKGLYSTYLEQGEAFTEMYDELLKATGKKTIAQVGKMVNIDVNSIDFWRSSLKLLEDDINLFIHLSTNLINQR